MRAFRLGLALLALANGPAAAVCRCDCVAGRMRPQCSGQLDPPAICDRICPPSVGLPGAPATLSGAITPQGGDATLATGSPALLGATGLPGR